MRIKKRLCCIALSSVFASSTTPITSENKTQDTWVYNHHYDGCKNQGVHSSIFLRVRDVKTFTGGHVRDTNSANMTILGTSRNDVLHNFVDRVGIVPLRHAAIY